MKKPTQFNTVTVVEPTYLGEYGIATRIASYRVEAWSGGQWRELFAGESPREMVYRTEPASAQRMRLTLGGTGKPPGIAEFGLYEEPERRISRR
jgi:alpha-L-fucosidase